MLGEPTSKKREASIFRQGFTFPGDSLRYTHATCFFFSHRFQSFANIDRRLVDIYVINECGCVRTCVCVLDSRCAGVKCENVKGLVKKRRGCSSGGTFQMLRGAAMTHRQLTADAITLPWPLGARKAHAHRFLWSVRTSDGLRQAAHYTGALFFNKIMTDVVRQVVTETRPTDTRRG